VETVYGSLLNGAHTADGGTFVTSLVAGALQAYGDAALSNLDGIPGTWRLVTAQPGNWSTKKARGFRTVQFDLETGTLVGLESPFSHIGEPKPPAQWKLRLGAQSRSLSKGTNLSKVQVDLLEVSLGRSWLSGEFFSTAGWSLPGQKVGFASSGSLTSNDGVLPLIVTSMLVFRSVKLDWSLAAEDLSFLHSATSQVDGNDGSSLGPLPLPPEALGEKELGGGKDLGKLYLLGFISQLVPLSPESA
jgi:hypothetical protein